MRAAHGGSKRRAVLRSDGTALGCKAPGCARPAHARRRRRAATPARRSVGDALVSLASSFRSCGAWRAP